MPLEVYPPYPAFAALAAVLLVVCSYMYLRERRRANGRGRTATPLVLVVVFGVATAGLSLASYQEYVQMNTWTYFYEMDVQPNSTATQAVVVPIPQDPALLADLHLVSGMANWSFTQTTHGRGLYLQFAGSAALESAFSEMWSDGSSHDARLTMTNATVPAYGGPFWVYCAGSGGVTLHLQSGGAVSNGSPVLDAGWNLVYLLPHP